MAQADGGKIYMLTIKYRPHTLNDVKGQEQVVELIRSQSISDEWFPVQLLYGKYGCGKTTIARVIGESANCKHKDKNGNPCLVCDDCKAIMEGTHPDVVEIAAAVHNGVDDIRELIQNADFKPVSLKYKVYIIDEVHMLSKGAFNALLKLLENPPEHCIFILCTTEKDMILDTIQSRTAPYSFTSIPMETIKEHVLYVSEKEGFEVTEDAASVISKRAFGSMRTALMLLEMATKENGKATGESVEKMLGVSKPAEVFDVLKAMVMQDKAALVRKMVALNESGASVHELVSDLSEGMTDLALASVYPEGLFGSDSYVSMVKDIIPHGSTELFQAIAGELVALKGFMPRDMRGQDLTVKLLGILVSNKVSECSNNLLKMVEQLKQEVVQLKSGAVTVKVVEALAEPVEETTMQEEVVKPDESAEDDFSDINVEAIRNGLAECGMVGSQIVDEEKFNNNPHIKQMVAVAEEIYKEHAKSFSEAVESEVPFIEEPKKETPSEPEGKGTFEMSAELFSFMMGGMELPDFPIVSQEKPVSVEKKEQKPEPVSDLRAEYQILATLSDEEEAFKAAMMGCETKNEEGYVVIRTPFPQTVQFVEAYLRAYHFRYPESDLERIKVRTTDELIG